MRYTEWTPRKPVATVKWILEWIHGSRVRLLALCTIVISLAISLLAMTGVFGEIVSPILAVTALLAAICIAYALGRYGYEALVKRRVSEDLVNEDATIGYLARIRVLRQRVFLGSDTGTAWFSDGQFCFRGRETQFRFAASRVESCKNHTRIERPTALLTLSSPVPLHQLEVTIIEPRSWAVDAMSTFKRTLFQESEIAANDGTLPPRTFETTSWDSYVIALHEAGAPIRRFGRSLINVSLFFWLLSQFECVRSSITDVTAWIALGFMAWLASIPVSYAFALAYVPFVRRRVTAAIALDPV